MKEINQWLNDSVYTHPLSPACKMCADGSKMVVLITGICPVKCFYCPLSKRKQGRDRIFADEWELKDENDTDKLISEAELIEASGAGFTGGDPLLIWERTRRYIKFLKDNFGSDFHIHLYTSGVKNSEHIEDLVSAGLDEIRFHPLPQNWKNMEKVQVIHSIDTALEFNVDVAIEIPSIPKMEDDMFTMISWASDFGIKWVNLNELEYSETNTKELNYYNYTVKDEISAAVLGSEETAKEVVRKCVEEDLSIGVHYCSSSFKDGIQLRNRLKRRAENIAREFDVITEEGTLLKGVISSRKLPLKKVYNLLIDEYKIKEKYIEINHDKNRVEMALWILEKIALNLRKKKMDCFMVEEYPTADALEVERAPLPL